MDTARPTSVAVGIAFATSTVRRRSGTNRRIHGYRGPPRPTLYVLALQAGAALASMAPVFFSICEWEFQRKIVTEVRRPHSC